ncbi:MAG: heme ABC exporter ATP-binding protein CcmA [Candidatus Eisenbacteria bacterium]
MISPPAISGAGVVRRFGFIRALDGVTVEARAGETVLLLGSNGAGKTTLLRILAGLLLANGGEVSICGCSPRANEKDVRRRIGFLSHELALYGELTASENLRFFGRIYRLRDREERVRAALREAGLEAWRDEQARAFSRGMKQRLALARVFLHGPDVLLLDEPFTGLDLSSARSLAERLADARERGAALILSSHRLEVAAPLGDRAVILKKGRVVERVDLGGHTDVERTARLRALLEEKA